MGRRHGPRQPPQPGHRLSQRRPGSPPAWRPALRLDWFRTEEHSSAPADQIRERGTALTVALNWRPREWLRLTGEVLRIDSWRTQRRALGEDPGSVDTQAQLSARFLF